MKPITVLLIFVAGWTCLLAQSMDAKQCKATVYIAEVEADTSFYFGVGYAEIDEEGFDKAVQKARTNARDDLAGKIESQISVEFIHTISGNKETMGDSYSETIHDVIKKKSSTYTDVVLTDLHREKRFVDYPKAGMITCVVQKSKQEYRKQVTRQLAKSKDMICATIQNGDALFAAGKQMAAVHDWVMAKLLQIDNFGDLPLQAKVQNSPQKKDITSYLNHRITEFFDGLTISCVNDEGFVYDTQGSLNAKPMIYVQYLDAKGQKQGVAKLPLKVNFVVGNAQMPTEILSGDYGQAELSIASVDAWNPETTLSVEVDTQRIEQLDLFSLPVISTLTLNLHKKHTIAVSVNFKNGETTTSPRSLSQELKSLVLSLSFDATTISIPRADLEQTDIQQINETYADLFLHVYLHAPPAQTVGGYGNMFVTNCDCFVTLYRLPQGTVIASEPIPPQKGFGASEINAGMNAFDKIEPLVKAAVTRALKKQ